MWLQTLLLVWFILMIWPSKATQALHFPVPEINLSLVVIWDRFGKGSHNREGDRAWRYRWRMFPESHVLVSIFPLKCKQRWKGFFHSITSSIPRCSMSPKSKWLPLTLVTRKGAVWYRTCWDRCKMMGISRAKPRKSLFLCKRWWWERNCKDQTHGLEAAAPAFLIPVLILILVSVGLFFWLWNMAELRFLWWPSKSRRLWEGSENVVGVLNNILPRSSHLNYPLWAGSGGKPLGHGTWWSLVVTDEQNDLHFHLIKERGRREWHFASGCFFWNPKELFCVDISPKLSAVMNF